MALKTNHTPGPWKLKRVTREDSEDICVQGPDGRTYEGRYVAIVCTTGANPCEEDNNNALLIAAAPELLRVLQVVEDSIDFDETNRKGLGKLVHDAIAKAQP